MQKDCGRGVLINAHRKGVQYYSRNKIMKRPIIFALMSLSKINLEPGKVCGLELPISVKNKIKSRLKTEKLFSTRVYE